MGCDIHAVIQKQDNTGEWNTALVDVLSGRNHRFFDWLKEGKVVSKGHNTIVEEKNDGFPDLFEIDEEGSHEGFWMGDYGFGYINLNDLCLKETNPVPKLEDRFTLQKSAGCVEIYFEDLEDIDEDAYIRTLQQGMISVFGPYFGDLSKYRLVFGFDC